MAFSLNLGNISIRFSADITGFLKATARVAQEIVKTVGVVTKAFSSMASAAAKAFGSVGRGSFAKGGAFNPASYIPKMPRMGGGGGLNMLDLVGAGLVYKGISSVIDHTYEVVEKAIVLAAEYRTALASFEVMAGDTRVAKDLLDSIQAFAAATPFKSRELIAASRTLAGFGVEIKDVIPALKALGEITSAAGGGADRLQRLALAYGQVTSKGFLKGEELRQFANAGVAVGDIAAGLGVTTAKLFDMMKKGQVDIDKFNHAINNMAFGAGRFAGAMMKISMTPEGRWNAILENMELGLQSLGLKFFEGLEKAKVFDVLERIVVSFKQWTNDQESMVMLGELIRIGLVAAETAIKSIKNIFVEIFGMITGTQKAGGMTMLTFFVGQIAGMPALLKEGFLFVKGVVQWIIGAVNELLAQIVRTVASVVGGIPSLLGGGEGAAKKIRMGSNLFALDANAKDWMAASGKTFGQVGTTYKKTMEEFWKNLGNREGNGDVLRQELEKLNNMRLSENAAIPGYVRQATEYIKQVTSKEDKNVDAFTEFINIHKGIQAGLTTKQQAPKGFKGDWPFMQVDDAGAGMAYMAMLGSLRQKFGADAKSQDKQPTVRRFGSVEARDFLDKQPNRQLDIAEEVLDLLKTAQEHWKQTAEETSETRRAFEKVFANNPQLLIVPVEKP